MITNSVMQEEAATLVLLPDNEVLEMMEDIELLHCFGF